MDFRGIDLGGVFYFAMFGVICAVVGAFGAAGALIWFVVNHVRII